MNQIFSWLLKYSDIRQNDTSIQAAHNGMDTNIIVGHKREIIMKTRRSTGNARAIFYISYTPSFYHILISENWQ